MSKTGFDVCSCKHGAEAGLFFSFWGGSKGTLEAKPDLDLSPGSTDHLLSLYTHTPAGYFPA